MADDGAFVGNSRNLHSFVVTGFGIGEGVSGFVEEECCDKAYGEKDSGEKSVHEKDVSVMILGCYSIAMAGVSFLLMHFIVVFGQRCHVVRFDVRGTQGCCKGIADKVLEMLSVACTSDALVHDGKRQLVSVWCHGITGKCADTLDSTGFCPYAVLCTLPVATASERTVLSHYGQCG